MSLYGWLLDKNNFPKTHRAYLKHNPFHNLAKRELRGVVQLQVKRLFPEKALVAMLEAAQRDCDALAVDAPRSSPAAARRTRLRAERTRWILILLFVAWLRRDELARLRMKDFRQEHLEGKWTLQTLGKGNKPRTIPLPQLIIAALVRYREAMGLPALPAPDDPLPAVLPIPRGRAEGCTQATPLSVDVIYTAVKSIARKAADTLEASDPEEAKRPGSDLSMTIRTLRSLSPHWFRHSGATTALNRGMPLQEASKLLGHASPATTANMYHHLDDEAVRDRLEATFGRVIS
jgi:integrase